MVTIEILMRVDEHCPLSILTDILLQNEDTVELKTLFLLLVVSFNSRENNSPPVRCRNTFSYSRRPKVYLGDHSIVVGSLCLVLVKIMWSLV